MPVITARKPQTASSIEASSVAVQRLDTYRSVVMKKSSYRQLAVCARDALLKIVAEPPRWEFEELTWEDLAVEAAMIRAWAAFIDECLANPSGTEYFLESVYKTGFMLHSIYSDRVVRIGFTIQCMWNKCNDAMYYGSEEYTERLEQMLTRVNELALCIGNVDLLNQDRVIEVAEAFAVAHRDVSELCGKISY